MEHPKSKDIGVILSTGPEHAKEEEVIDNNDGEEEIVFQLDVSKDPSTAAVEEIDSDSDLRRDPRSNVTRQSDSHSAVRNPCIFWSKPSGCKNGSRCPFAHSLASEPKGSQLAQQPKQYEVCIHFARGRCRAGVDCRFLHGELPHTVLSREHSQHPKSVEETTMNLESGIAFADGLLGEKKRKLCELVCSEGSATIAAPAVDADSLLEKYSMRAYLSRKKKHGEKVCKTDAR